MAFIELKKHYSQDIQLVIAGKAYDDYCEPEKIIQKHQLSDSVILTGYVSDDLLDCLYKNAYLFIIPSLYEGFGIPVLEAMRVGTPVLTSNLTAMPEVAGGAALLVDPHNIDDITVAMSRLLRENELRQNLIVKGRERASSYSWQGTAQLYLDLYEGLCS